VCRGEVGGERLQRVVAIQVVVLSRARLGEAVGVGQQGVAGVEGGADGGEGRFGEGTDQQPTRRRQVLGPAVCPQLRAQPQLASAEELPPWIGDDTFHRSHRSALVRKDPATYAPLFPGVPDDLPYVWPASDRTGDSLPEG
jgi:hypothetical protein